MPLQAIRSSYPMGVDLASGAWVTDDTQMTLFTADGLIRALLAGVPPERLGESTQLWQAYQRWLLTQQSAPSGEDGDWLLSHPALWQVRAPGNTCLSALRGKRPGRTSEPVNNSKGCGGVMRAAPAGFLPDPSQAYRVGCDLAAMTHGHPSGWIAGGALALLAHQVTLGGQTLLDAVDTVLATVFREPSGGEVADAVSAAARAARQTPRDVSTVVRLGEGWVAEEALAIAVYAALSYPDDILAALRLAVEHGGDSDSTGAIAGNILGAAQGVGAVPARWLDRVELADVITAVADDLAAACVGDLDTVASRYGAG